MSKRIFCSVVATAWLTALPSDALSAITQHARDHYVYLLSVESAEPPQLPHMDGAKWTQFGPCSSPVLCIMEGKVKRVAGDSIVSDLLANVTHDKYGLNPQLDIFLAEAPANTADFDTKFNELDQTIRENVSACSKKTYKSLDSWLKKEAQAANTTAESASVEYEGYGNNTVIAIENYFAHANTKIMDLIAYVTDNKPVF